MTEDKVFIAVFIAVVVWLFFHRENQTGGSFATNSSETATPFYLNYNYSPNYNYVPNMLPQLTSASGTCDSCSLMP